MCNGNANILRVGIQKLARVSGWAVWNSSTRPVAHPWHSCAHPRALGFEAYPAPRRVQYVHSPHAYALSQSLVMAVSAPGDDGSPRVDLKRGVSQARAVVCLSGAVMLDSLSTPDAAHRRPAIRARQALAYNRPSAHTRCTVTAVASRTIPTNRDTAQRSCPGPPRCSSRASLKELPTLQSTGGVANDECAEADLQEVALEGAAVRLRPARQHGHLVRGGQGEGVALVHPVRLVLVRRRHLAAGDLVEAGADLLATGRAVEGEAAAPHLEAVLPLERRAARLARRPRAPREVALKHPRVRVPPLLRRLKRLHRGGRGAVSEPIRFPRHSEACRRAICSRPNECVPCPKPEHSH